MKQPKLTGNERLLAMAIYDNIRMTTGSKPRKRTDIGTWIAFICVTVPVLLFIVTVVATLMGSR